MQSRSCRFDPVAGSQLPIAAGIITDGQQPVENGDSMAVATCDATENSVASNGPAGMKSI